MSDEQARYDREFLIIAVCHVWHEQVAPLLRAWKPLFDAVNESEAPR